MIINQHTQLGELVAADYRTAAIFKKYNIDFCCNGQRSIESACAEGKTDLSTVLSELREVTNGGPSNAPGFDHWRIDLLAEYIQQKHHRYVREAIADIRPYLTKISAVHGAAHPELHTVRALFEESAEELTEHMKKEEAILFSYIQQLVQAEKGDKMALQQLVGTVENPIAAMKQEHEDEGERFRKIAALTDQYSTPADGCTTYRLTMQLLKAFEEDLHLHIHLENNILFPKAMQLEAKVNTPGKAMVPVKRHPSLRPLSREHHHALLLVWKIREGVRKQVPAFRIEKYTAWFYTAYILPHLAVEEKFVYPILSDAHVLIVRALDEHRKLRGLFEAPQKRNEELLLLATVLENHIRFEERELFARLQEEAGEAALRLIADNCTHMPFTENEEDAFWK